MVPLLSSLARLALLALSVAPLADAQQVPTLPKTWEVRVEKPNKERLPNDEPEWLAKNPQADNPQRTELLLSADERQLMVIKPERIRVYSAADGALQWEQQRDQLFKLLLTTTRGEEPLPAKTYYAAVPHLNGVLDLYYGSKQERISFIDLQTREVRWVNEELRWSLERYATYARFLLAGSESRGRQIAGSALADILAPERVIATLIRQIPEVNGLLVKTIGGLTLLDLGTGKVRWETSAFTGGLAFVYFDPGTKDLVLVNRDDDVFSLPGIQFRKQLMRISAETGTVRWTNSYQTMYREKLDGIGTYDMRTIDVRVVGNTLLLNFLDLEAFDLTTGQPKWRIATEMPAIMRAMNPESSVNNLFAFPRIADGVIYRPAFSGVGLSGVDVSLEAIDLETGKMRWVVEKLNRGQWITSLVVLPDRLVVSVAGAEGISGIDRSTGKVLWKTPLPLRGQQEHLLEAGGTVLVRVGNGVVGLDTQTGAKRYEISAKDLKIAGTGILAAGAGQLSRSLTTDGVALIAGPTGMAMLDIPSGKVLSQVEYPSARRDDRFDYQIGRRADGQALLTPTKPIGSVVLAEPAARKVMGLLPTSPTRTRLVFSADGRTAYALDDGRLQRFEVR